MSRAPPGRTFASYRDSVTELIESGEPFGVAEDAIDDFAELSEEMRAALWLLAFAMEEQRRDGGLTSCRLAAGRRRARRP